MEASGFKAGTNQITFSNGGGQLRHVVITRLAEGATLDKAQELFATEDFKGPPPVDFDTSEITAVLDAGGKEVDTVELQSGSYALLCGGPTEAAAFANATSILGRRSSAPVMDPDP